MRIFLWALIYPHSLQDTLNNQVLAIQNLIQDMRDTVIDADGAGLAAPQIYESKRIVILRFHHSEDFQVWINPEITPLSEEQLLTFEGCLSVPGVNEEITRPDSIYLSWQDDQRG